MPDLDDRIRDTRPATTSADTLDVDDLRRRARRRTRTTRVTTVLGAAATLGVAGVVVAGALGTGPSVRIEPGGTAGGPAAPSSSAPPSPTTSPTTSPSSDLPQGEILARPTPGAPAAPDAVRPAAPACGAESLPDGIATITIGPETPQPRCLQVLPGQRIRLVNGTSTAASPGDAVTAALGGFRVRLAPDADVVLDLPVSNYLAAGVHTVDSTDGRAQADVWVLRAPSASLGQQAVLDALVGFARRPGDGTYAQLPLASSVALGDRTGIADERAAEDLRDPAAWQLATGTSALDLVAGTSDELVFTVGARPACGGPMPPAPEGLADLTRMSLQVPFDTDCEGWFAVDLYVDDQGVGQIHAVVVDTGTP